MHDEVLNENQKRLLNLISKFKSQFGLVGGTAIALHLGHRRSIDFDLFTNTDFDNYKIREIIRQEYVIQSVLVDSPNELSILVLDVKITFLRYPFKIDFSVPFDKYINLPDLMTLAIMKAFALGRRAKWKDYVDMYFILQKLDLKQIAEKSNKLFLGEFNEKLFREQLSYFEGVDYSEKVEYTVGFEVSDDKIKKFLVDVSLDR